jgi:hypothetical protein
MSASHWVVEYGKEHGNGQGHKAYFDEKPRAQQASSDLHGILINLWEESEVLARIDKAFKDGQASKLA